MPISTTMTGTSKSPYDKFKQPPQPTGGTTRTQGGAPNVPLLPPKSPSSQTAPVPVPSVTPQAQPAITTGGSSIEAQVQQAVQEAKLKQEASKTSALGYYDTLQTQVQSQYGGLESQLGQISKDLITPEQQQQLMAQRRGQLGAYGQNLLSQFGDEESGVQMGQRANISRDIGLQQANLPINMALEIGAQNRQAQLGVYDRAADISAQKVGAYGNVAAGKSGIQQNYQYDPGLEYAQQAGYGAGYQATLGTGNQAGTPQVNTVASFIKGTSNGDGKGSTGGSIQSDLSSLQKSNVAAYNRVQNMTAEQLKNYLASSQSTADNLSSYDRNKLMEISKTMTNSKSGVSGYNTSSSSKGLSTSYGNGGLSTQY